MIHALSHGARRAMLAATASVIALTISAPAHAGGSSMPWEAPLQSILESIEGPVAKIVAVIIIIVTGLTLAFGDTSGGFRRLIQIVFGLSIAFAASSFFLSFFSFGAFSFFPVTVQLGDDAFAFHVFESEKLVEGLVERVFFVGGFRQNER